MKGYTKAIVVTVTALTLGACSSMREIPERDNYAQPKWYSECAEAGTEGYFWWKQEYAYACGAGESRFYQAAEEQMYAIAMNHYAKRINGVVDSSTKLTFINDSKNTETIISYSVDATRITEHLAEDRGNFVYQGKHYTFVRLKMEKEVFDRLLNSNGG